MNCHKCGEPIENKVKAHYGLHPTCFCAWFKTPQPMELASLQRKQNTSESDPDANHSHQNLSFFHGKYKKYSAELNGESYLLKMRQEDAQELPEVEYLCNQIGALIGIPVSDFYYIDFMGENTFVTKNFIKPGAPTDLQHIYHFRSNKDHSCEGIIKAIYDNTQRRHDISTFVKTLLFDALIGNHDRHGRNLGFIVTAKGKSLSPIYYNVSYLSLESGGMLQAQHNPTGKVNTKANYEPSMRDYVIEFKRLGYQDEINEFHQACKLPKVLELIENSFCSIEMKAAIKKLVTTRFGELENEINA